MSAFNLKNYKIFICLMFLAVFSFSVFAILPKYTHGQEDDGTIELDPTKLPKILNLEKVSLLLNSSTNKYDWKVKITTVRIPDGTSIGLSLAKNGVIIKNDVVVITGGVASYEAMGLEPNATFVIVGTATYLEPPKPTDSISVSTQEESVDKVLSPDIDSAATVSSTDTTYTLLAPIPKVGEEGCKDKDGKVLTDTTGKPIPCVETAQPNAFGRYLNQMIQIFIGICAVLAMVMIVMGGIEYMTSELVSGKEAGKEKITHAVLGLLLALGAFAILNTINPQLLDVSLSKLPKATVTITAEETLRNRAGGGVCAPIDNASNPCSPANLTSTFSGTSTSAAPFNTMAAQASAICSLESHGVANTVSSVDLCSDNKPFSFGLFQINGSAHRATISACNGAFIIPSGHGASQGNRISSGSTTWTCTTHEPEYTACKNYLLNPTNNIAFAVGLHSQTGWDPTWSTYSSCSAKFPD